MASSKYGEGIESFWVDKDGVPHWDGSEPARFLKQYKARVSVEFEANCGTTDPCNTTDGTDETDRNGESDDGESHRAHTRTPMPD